MKYLLITFLLFPVSAFAVMLGDCDKNSYDVIVRNGGNVRIVRLTPYSGEIQEFGPVVSFQINGQSEVVIREPNSEYCVWSGKIKIQRMNTLNTDGGSVR
jgi:hypothetical protein